MKGRGRPNFSRSPMFWLAGYFAVGILAAKLWHLPLTVAAAASLVFAAAALVLRSRAVAGWLVALAFAAGGAATARSEIEAVKGDRLKVLYDGGVFASATPVQLEGVMNGRPEPSFDGAFLTMRSELLRYRGQDHPVSGHVRIFVPTSSPESEISNLTYGSRIRVACSLKREDEYLNPGVQPRREILDRQNIDATCSLKSSMLVEHLADESVFLPLAWVYDQRAGLIDDFRHNLRPSAAGVMIASLLGNKYFLDKETADLYRDGGTFHILVISGLHITFIGGMLLWFLRRCTKNRWTQFCITTTVLWAYTLAVGADVPVVRAALMFTVLAFAYAIYRRGTLLNSLGVASLALLVWRPSDLFNPSFQLTFVSVAAIIAIAYPLLEYLRAIGSWTPTPDRPFPPNVPNWLRRWCEMLYWRPEVWSIESKRQIWSAGIPKSAAVSLGEATRRMAGYIFDGLLVSVIVQLVMLPLSIIYFHRVSVSSLVLNLWVGFFIAVESFLAVAAAILSRLSELLAYPFFLCANALNWMTLLLPHAFSSVHISSFRPPAYVGAGRLIYVLFFVPVVAVAVMLIYWDPFRLKPPSKLARRSLLAAGLSAAVLAGTMILHPYSSPRADGRLHIDHLDVGQGDSALITFPNGEIWLVDAGGMIDYRRVPDADPFEPDTRGIGEMVVSEVLWEKGYSSVDRIVATHADADHIGGMSDVAKNFVVRRASFAPTREDDPEFAELSRVLGHRRIPIETISRGDRFDVGGATVEVLHPRAVDGNFAGSDNNNSLVLRITYGSRTFLLTGDIEKEAEAELLSGELVTGTDVVKVAHHGSRSSSIEGFVNAAHPTLAIISVGRRSPFGHPHREVVERWLSGGAVVATTGENGMITLSTDGTDLKVSHFAQ